MHRYSVLIVDDSAFMRKIIADLITDHSEFDVIGTAKNGQEAVDKAKQLKPDVITLDVEMPIMNGLDALKIIMSEQPVPVIMLSSLTDFGTRETIRSLELGAVDFVRKPSGSISLDLYKVKDLLLEKLRIAVSAKVTKIVEIAPIRPVVKTVQTKGQKLPQSIPTQSRAIDQIVVMGTSTGGPKALQTVLTQLPAEYPAPLLIVQHMPPNFTRSLAERLDSLCELHVVEAADQMLLSSGTVYIAPGGWHMQVIRSAAGEFRIQLSKEEPRSGHRPSVDVLFESLVPYNDIQRYAVIMTGMGADGAAGMKKLKDSGAVATIAESEQTCVVYGMPKSAIELEAADYILNLQHIAQKLIDLVQMRS